MNDLWLFMIVVITIGCIIKSLVFVSKGISNRKTIQSVEDEIRNLFELFAYAPDLFREQLHFYYREAYVDDLDIIVYGKDMMPDINGIVRLRIEWGNTDSDSSLVLPFLRISIRGIDQLNQSSYEGTCESFRRVRSVLNH